MFRHVVVAAFLLLLCTRASPAPRFQGLGFLPLGLQTSRALAISADGSVIVGSRA